MKHLIKRFLKNSPVYSDESRYNLLLSNASTTNEKAKLIRLRSWLEEEKAKVPHGSTIDEILEKFGKKPLLPRVLDHLKNKNYKGLHSNKFSLKMGISQSNLSRLNSGQRKSVEAEVLMKLCKFYKIKVISDEKELIIIKDSKNGIDPAHFKLMNEMVELDYKYRNLKNKMKRMKNEMPIPNSEFEMD
jgi:DNA-binding Xre family transcriptional regulator